MLEKFKALKAIDKVLICAAVVTVTAAIILACVAFL